MEKSELYTIIHDIQKGEWISAYKVKCLKDTVINNDLKEFAEKYLQFCTKPFSVFNVCNFPLEPYEWVTLERALKKISSPLKQREGFSVKLQDSVQTDKQELTGDDVADSVLIDARNDCFKREVQGIGYRLQSGGYPDLTKEENEILGKYVSFVYEAFCIAEELKILGLYVSEFNEHRDIVSKSSQINLPPELDNDRAREYLNKAQEAGFIAKTSTGYKWTMTAGRGALAQLAYFCGRVYCPGNVGKLPETALNRLFGVSRIGAALTQVNNARPQKWRQKIDSIFED